MSATLDVDVLLPTLLPIFAGSVRVWRSHQVNADGVNLLQAHLSTLTLQVIEEETGDIVGTYSVTVSTSVFNTLQTASGIVLWKADSSGFNVLYKTTPAQTPNAGKTYLFIFKATPTSGDPWYFGFRQPTFSKKYT